MFASGQFVSDVKNRYIRKNQAAVKTLPEEKKLPKQPVDYDTSPIPEDDFKHVKNTLKLNQSAMHADKDKRDLANQKLEDLAEKSDTVLAKVSTVFPFTFFVNDIIVDPYKVNIIYREFFFSEHIHSIMVKDILDVVVETSLFFATVKIVDQGYVENSVNIAYLKKNDALKIRKIIQGLVIAHRQAVDLSVLHPEHIKTKAEELGQVKGIDDSQRKIENL